MSKALLYPMTVSAKVVRRPPEPAAAWAVPTLDGAPFNLAAGLEPGVHVHWALPDALTSAQVLAGDAAGKTLFPGVPDLWLVVRLNPGAANAKRTWVAWVVDAYAQTVMPLSGWQPPTNRAPGTIHTLAGLLPHATASGHPGWGVFDTADPALQKSFQPAMAGYYPAARRRFGFYDSLAEFKGNLQGNVTYFVLGWYWDHQHDPLWCTPRPFDLLDNWQTLVTSVDGKAADLGTIVSLGNAGSNPPATNFKSKPAPASLPAQKLAALRRINSGGNAVDAVRTRQDRMVQSFPVASGTGATADLIRTVGAQVATRAPRQAICHGSVVGVPLSGGNTAPVAIADADVALYPNVKRALASLAAKTGQPQQVDALEMLLGGLEGQTSSVGGVLDLPSAAHALTFQSVPGKPMSYARIRVAPGWRRSSAQADPDPHGSQGLAQRGASGHWPGQPERSEPPPRNPRLPKMPGSPVLQRPAPPAPADPGVPDLAAVRAAFLATTKAVGAKKMLIHPSLIYVSDGRSAARSPRLGPTTDQAGSDGAGWWLDIGDTNAITRLLQNVAGVANLTLPTAGDLYTVPGPRWYRPWSPQIVLTNVGRSYKFGADKRFRPDGKVQTRLGGDTVRSLGVGAGRPVVGADLLGTPESLNVPGLPGEVVALLHEALLLDTESAVAMSAVAGTAATGGAKMFTNAILALKFAADPSFNQGALGAVAVEGTPPSPIAVTLWNDPVDPLFLDVQYSLLQTGLDKQWDLLTNQVDFKPLSSTATPTVGSPPPFQERALVTSTIVNIVKSAMLTRQTLDPQGNPVTAMKVDPTLKEDVFDKLNVVSAALTGLDGQPADKVGRLRAGALRVDQLAVVDMFGFRRTWNATAKTPPTSNWIAQPPRLPYWSRLQFRLQAAGVATDDASPSDPPVVGLLVPDLVEHALEVFDAHGIGIGQLTTDRPIYGTPAVSKDLLVRFKPHPWVKPPTDDPLSAIGNLILRDFVRSVAAQKTTVTQNQPGTWETGLSALLRVIDTIRSTLDPNAQTADRKVRLIGEPILVLGAQLRFEATATPKPGELAGDPPLLNGADMPTLPVRVGDIMRPDDGVLGCFIRGSTEGTGRFAPVTREASEKATLNPLLFGTDSTGTDKSWGVVHPFLKDPGGNLSESKFPLKVGDSLSLVILADIRGGVYATCGALPRKKITLPQEYVDAAVRNLEPSFYAGPVLATQLFDSERVLVPLPEVPGYTVGFICRKPDEKELSQLDVSAMPPLTELPQARVLLTEGWMRISKDK